MTTCTVPASLNLEKVLTEQHHYLANDCYLLLDMIHARQACIDLYRVDVEMGIRQYSPISQIDMRRVMTKRSIPTVIRLLKENGIIEVDRQYLVGTQGDCTITHFPTSTFSR